MVSGSFVSTCAIGTSKSSWRNGASSWPMRRCGIGAGNSGRPKPINCAAGAPGRETSGTWTRCFYASRANATTCGAPSTRTAISLNTLVQRRRGTDAGKKFFRKPLKGLTDVPRVIITDQFKSYARRSGRCCLVWNTGSAATSTAVRRTPTNRPGSAGDACKALSRPGTPSISPLRMAPWRRISVPGATSSRLEHTACRCPRDSSRGRRSPTRPGPRTSRVRCRAPPLGLVLTPG
jgi:hypothetical protein